MHKPPSTKVGDTYTSNKGDVVTVTEYETSKKMKVMFDDGVEIKTTQGSLKRGSFAHPTKGKMKVGDTFKSSRGCIVTVVDYISSAEVHILWDDGITTSTSAGALRSGGFIHPTRWKIPVGTLIKLNSGETVTVVEYNSAINIVLEFSDGVRVTAPRTRIDKGSVAHPTKGVRIGEKFTTVSGWEGEVVGYNNANDVTVMWQDGTTQKTSTNYIKSGSIKPITQPCLANVGFSGFSMRKGDKESAEKSYVHWQGMIGRCYDEKTRAMPKNKSYHDCTVTEEWNNYATFKEWVTKQVGYGAQCNHIDKDILVKGNREYHPDKCILLPSEINLAVSHGSVRGKGSALPPGVTKIDKGFVARSATENGREYLGFFKSPEEAFEAHKIRKERYIKFLATKWQSQIDPRAYDALMAYTVEITD